LPFQKGVLAFENGVLAFETEFLEFENVVTFFLYHDCNRLVRATLQQVYHQACSKLLTTCSKLVTATGNKQC
jgi:hypothetical protein